jgi:hypothetical protein
MVGDPIERDEMHGWIVKIRIGFGQLERRSPHMHLLCENRLEILVDFSLLY